METTFQTGHEWNDSNYVVNVLETHLLPIASALIFLFTISLVYVCNRQYKEVHEFTRLLALITALTMAMLAFSYSLGDTASLLRTRINAALAYKDLTIKSLLDMNTTLTDLYTDPFERTCPAANFSVCQKAKFFRDTELYLYNLAGPLNSVITTFQGILDVQAQAYVQSNLDTWQNYVSMLQWVIYALFVGIGTLIWISILGKVSGKKFLHGFAGLLSFVCLILGLTLLVGSNAMADLCSDPQGTLAQLVKDPNIAFYFNCTPDTDGIGPYRVKGPFPPLFDGIKTWLYLEPFFSDVYLEVCFVDQRYLNRTLKDYELLKRNEIRSNCTCPCNYTLIEGVKKSIYSTFDNSGVFNAFQCSSYKTYITGMTSGLCGFFSPCVGYFFLLLSLSGHALFLFYFVPYKKPETAFSHTVFGR